jgi:hypothetical protein
MENLQKTVYSSLYRTGDLLHSNHDGSPCLSQSSAVLRPGLENKGLPSLEIVADCD